MAVGPEWQGGWARQPSRNENKPGLLWPPSHVCPAEGWRGWGATAFSHRSWAGPSYQVLPLHLGCSWQCPESRQGPEPMAGHSHFDFIVLLSISKLEGVCLHCAGHWGPAACLGCAPLFIQALPRSPSLGQHSPQLLAPGISPSVVAAALVVPPACSPVPARGHASRCTGILFHWAGPHLSHWAQPSGYPIGAVSTGLGACSRGWGACGKGRGS